MLLTGNNYYVTLVHDNTLIGGSYGYKEEGSKKGHEEDCEEESHKKEEIASLFMPRCERIKGGAFLSLDSIRI